MSHLVEAADRGVYLLERGPFDPHSFLGLHPDPDREGGSILRVWRPGASWLFLEVEGEVVPMELLHPAGLFVWRVDRPTDQVSYRVYHSSGLLAEDPYRFWPALGEQELFYFNKGVHYRLWETMGAHPLFHHGVEGVRFVLWAPNAQRVALLADFNHWDGRVNPMRPMGSSGVWELFIPGLRPGEKYKFELRTPEGERLIKADPYAFASELRPCTASIVAEVDRFSWSDDGWMARRRSHNGALPREPMAIYELHLGSWKRREGKFLNYRELAVELAEYCQKMGFTHVELLPVAEHPLDESWGYQVTGYYSVTSRHGTVEDFQWFVNHLHNSSIGVLVDWVPAHFPTDDFSLAHFDGSSLYEHADPRQGFHPHWNTSIFNLGRHEVSNFLLANALFWCQVMHVDGLRVDAVASMLYLDYGREEGGWIPNRYGGKENLEAIEFFKHLNAIVHEREPGVLMIAEESTSFTGVTHPVAQGGLGFDYKWNMGWMNDTLDYFSRDMLFRRYHHQQLTFGMLYAYSERFTLVFSHDEVVHGKRSLLSRMPGDLWQRFANLRLLYSYMICQPGKKLLFMGGELAQWEEWNCGKQLDWALLNYPLHQGMSQLVADINWLYRRESALWQRDGEWSGFSWVTFNDLDNSVVSYLRHGDEGSLLCVHNFTPAYYPRYRLPLSHLCSLEELFNSDERQYGGAGNRNERCDLHDDSVEVTLAPLATMIFRPRWH